MLSNGYLQNLPDEKYLIFRLIFVQYYTQSLSISLEISASSLISKLQSCIAITNSELERNIWHVTKKAEIVTTYSASDLSDTRQMIVKVPRFSLAWYCGLWENCLLTSDPEPCTNTVKIFILLEVATHTYGWVIILVFLKMFDFFFQPFHSILYLLMFAQQLACFHK